MKKRTLSLLMSFIMLIGLLPATVFASDAAAAPEPITSAEEFAAMNASGNYILQKDITVTAPYKTFSGTFDGNGHTITLKIEQNNAYLGLFGTLNGGATIKNVIVDGTVSAGKNNKIGGIAGFANVYDGGISIINCQNKAAISGNKGIGGILGDCNGTTHPITIQNCVNTGKITGSNNQVGGIVGNLGKGHSVSYCYNRGDIKGLDYVGGIVGQSASTISYAYSTGSIIATSTIANPSKGDIFGGGKGSQENCFKLTSSSDPNIQALLSTGKYVADTKNINDGYPILSWQSSSGAAPSEPQHGISIRSTAGNSIWSAASGSHSNQTTLSVVPENMGTKDVHVTWTYPNNTDIATFNEDPTQGTLVVAAGKGGIAEVSASVEFGGNTYTATTKITVIPNIAYVDIVNLAGGAIAHGQTVTAQVLTDGNKPYDEENYPSLTYQWWSYDTGSGTSARISKATGKTYQIPDNYQYNRIQVEVSCNGEIVSGHDEHKTAPVKSADYGKLYPVAYDDALTLPTDIKEDTKLDLPATHTKDNVTARVEWSGFNDVIAADGTVTRPVSGKKTVTLKATFVYGTASANREFEITVWSQAAVDEEAGNKLLHLNRDIDAANLSALTPIYGTDTNVLEMVKSKLNRDDINASITAVEPTGAADAASSIAPNGDITYFYADPNQTADERLQWYGSYRITFAFARDGVEATREIPVSVYWDVERVESVMREEILSKVIVDAAEPVTEDFELPKIVDGKKWALSSWTSSDPAITISRRNQATVDTLFEPYVAVVRGGMTEKEATLTAAFTF